MWVEGELKEIGAFAGHDGEIQVSLNISSKSQVPRGVSVKTEGAPSVFYFLFWSSLFLQILSKFPHFKGTSDSLCTFLPQSWLHRVEKQDIFALTSPSHHLMALTVCLGNTGP